MELQEHSERAPILTNTDQCLVLYPFEDWCAFEEDLEQLSPVDPDVQSFRRLMVSGATECPIDKQGRILVPQPLREYAGIQKDVTIAGVGPCIELWDKARFDNDLNKTQARYHEISSSVAKLGR